MAVALEIKVNGNSAAFMAAKLGAIAGPALIQAIRGGLGTALELAAGSVVQNAISKGLKSRTGTLLNEVRGKLDAGEKTSGVVGVPAEAASIDYAWLLHDRQITIVPKNAKALSIPFGANLTGAGVARYPTVKSLIEAFGDRVFFKKRFVGVRSKTQKGSWQLYFILAMSSKPTPVNALVPGIEAAAADMTAEIQERVDRLIAEST